MVMDIHSVSQLVVMIIYIMIIDLSKEEHHILYLMIQNHLDKKKMEAL